MRYSTIRCFAIAIASILNIASLCSAAPPEESPLYFLPVSSIGIPAAEKQKEAQRINELKIFDAKLYIGHGDAVVNTGPTDIIYYDLRTERFVTKLTTDDEAIYRYQVLDGTLVIPGPDATEAWDLGNIYVLTTSGWEKRRTIPHAIHVNELASFRNQWYVCTGNYFDFGGDESYPFGAILRSDDEGQTWNLVYTTPYDEESVYRVGSLIPYQGELHAFIYAYTGMKAEDIPEEYRPYLGETMNGKHLIFTDDLFGTPDGVVYDGKRWHFRDLIPIPHVCSVSPIAFKDKLIMSVISGEYIDYLSLREGVPEQATVALYAFDGEKTERLSLEYDIIRDKFVKGGRLYFLIRKDGRYFIVETPDLKLWKYYAFPTSLEEPLSIELEADYFYIGMEDGNIFRSGDIERVGDLSHVEGREPQKIFVAAELPRDGARYWAAITAWIEWGKLAKISCNIKSENIIEITTSNIAAFTIFVPTGEIDENQWLILRIDRQQTSIDNLRGVSSLTCTYTDEKRWTVEKGTETAETFEPTVKVIGTTGTDLTRDGDDPPIGRWKADVVRSAASADVALINRGGIRRDLRTGDITLEDIFDLNYRNSICVFSANGKTLCQMMDFNCKLQEGERCSIAGFTMSYRVHDDPQKNTVATCSLDPKKEYRVATSNYLAERAERFFGEKIEYEDTGLPVTQAMVDWLMEHTTVPEIEPVIKVLR